MQARKVIDRLSSSYISSSNIVQCSASSHAFIYRQSKRKKKGVSSYETPSAKEERNETKIRNQKSEPFSHGNIQPFSKPSRNANVKRLKSEIRPRTGLWIVADTTFNHQPHHH
jgi:hypothetical protein